MFRRVVAAAILIAVAAILAVLAWPQLFGLQRTFGIAHVVSLRGAATAVAVILLAAVLLFALLVKPARRFLASVGVLLLAFALINTVVLAGRGFGDTSFETKAANDITVLSWNTLGDAPGAAAIAQRALDGKADIVTLPETTHALGLEVAAIMKAAGRPMWVYTKARDQISKSRSTTVLMSAELGKYTEDDSLGSTAVLPSIVLRPNDGTGPVVIGVHAVAPLAVEFGNWRSDLAWLAKACSGSNTVMAGDFNATLDHMAGLGATASQTLGSCADVALATGNAGVGTWPTTLPALAGAPIDHVMVTSGWKATGMRVIQDADAAGSDHRPIIAQLRATK